MTIKENPLSTFSVMFSIIAIAVSVGHLVAISFCLSNSPDAFMHIYHFLFASIASCLAGFLSSGIAILSGDEQGGRALFWNLSSIIIFIICVFIVRSFGAF